MGSYEKAQYFNRDGERKGTPKRKKETQKRRAILLQVHVTRPEH
jgi:hypothetical protein